jgi:hypothetical protein
MLHLLHMPHLAHKHSKYKAYQDFIHQHDFLVAHFRAKVLMCHHLPLVNAHQFVMLVTWTQTDIADFPP